MLGWAGLHSKCMRGDRLRHELVAGCVLGELHALHHLHDFQLGRRGHLGGLRGGQELRGAADDGEVHQLVEEAGSGSQNDLAFARSPCSHQRDLREGHLSIRCSLRRASRQGIRGGPDDGDHEECGGQLGLACLRRWVRGLFRGGQAGDSLDALDPRWGGPAAEGDAAGAGEVQQNDGQGRGGLQAQASLEEGHEQILAGRSAELP
mmetsp:Transcript_103176/g.296095  ORF Transcript_103176/g.296095 Transcript_103176/m.296095 type:complete len:206 (+) Transcript_103176:1100-1717(+)